VNINFTSFIRGAVIAAACIFALAMGPLLTSDSMMPVFVLAGIVLLAITSSFPSWLVIICIVCSLLTGRTGLGVGYWEIFALALIIRWCLTVPFHGGLFGQIEGKWTFICITGFTVVLFFHGFPALVGIGESVGRRLAVLSIASLGLSYLLLSGKLDLSKLPLLPWIGVVPGIITAGFDLINLAIPSALPITFFIYNDQNFELMAAFQGAQLSMIRIAGLRELGLGIAFLSLSYFACQRAPHLRRLLTQAGGTLMGALLAALSGYRAYVAQIALGTLIAAYARSKATFLLVCLCGLLGIGTLVFIHQQVAELPLPMQRALSWLPGDWDWRTKDDADGGFAWRAQIRDYYFARIFPETWLLGRGLAYDERIDAMQWMMNDPTLNIQYFVAIQNYHSGLVSTLDFVGVVGTLFFVAGCLRGIWNAFVILRNRENARPWQLWIAIMFLTANPPFWYTGFFDRIFPFFVIAMCLLELARREQATVSGRIEEESEKVFDYELEAT